MIYGYYSKQGFTWKDVKKIKDDWNKKNLQLA